MITQKQLKELLYYNPNTGIFIWRKRTPKMFKEGIRSKVQKCNIWNSKFQNTVAGWNDGHGRIVITIRPKSYMAHQLAYLYMTGNFPENEIDHKNRIPNDNRWKNLRPSTSSQNKANSKIRSTNLSGFKGVSWMRYHKKWMARGTVKYKSVFLGYFDTPQKAHKAYCKWAKNTFGEYARTA